VRGHHDRFALVLLRLTLFVVREIVENGRRVTERVDYFQNLASFIDGDFLSVPGVGDGLVLIVFEADVTQS